MTTYARIVFWEPCVSPHKSAFIRAVADRLGPAVDVRCVAHEGVPEARQALGWGDESGRAPPTEVAPSHERIAAIVDEGGTQCLHVFSGIRWFSTITTALDLVRAQGRAFAIMSEPRDDAGLRGAVRYLQSWLTESWLRRRVAFVLAIGRHGPPWFQSVGYRRERVFPFAYFLPPPAPQTDRRAWAGAQARADGAANVDRANRADPQTAARADANVALHVAYVGRLTETKGVRHLVAAIRSLGPGTRLTIIGDGELREALVAEAARTGIDATFCGVLPIEDVQRRMPAFDVLVLPSTTKDDGWGAVVSEALMAGTAVVASRHAGASILLDHPRNGRVVPPGDSEAIAHAIRTLARSGELGTPARHERATWAHDRLTARAGAAYFEQIVLHRSGRAARPKEFYL
ncbi:glycosyltransferase [Pararobbsia silviterrae]|uniref:Glycosyltransferase n=1 Tax=Pararobbsia silviterrae TaxID=1792498 RepID=A0A494Y9U6_9BURK|nr:glycosyltransferase [Pararobbsia silviterrae]RKP59136.1 glycosyltransferase [Pararobbsia silviterrae]